MNTLTAFRPTRSHLIWLSVLALSLLLMIVIGDAHAQTLNKALDGKASALCTEVKSLSQSKWIGVLLLIAGAAALVAVVRKQRDGYSNLLWIIVVAAVVPSVWSVLAGFGIAC